MVTLPKEFKEQISIFSSMFSVKVFSHSIELLTGAIICTGKRTVTSSLNVIGLGSSKRFHKYHRILSRSKWSAHKGSYCLLQLLVSRFGSKSEPLVFGIDETLERRWGKKIKARGIYRDSARSSGSHFIKSSGLRWISLMLLSPIGWADRVWALPFLTVLAPSERYHKKAGKQHKKITDWARQMMIQLRRWLPNRDIIVVGDRSYSSIEFLSAASEHVTFITSLRLDAALFDPLPENPPVKAGRPAVKGQRLPNLADLLESNKTDWQQVTIPQWYDQSSKKMLITTGTAVWYHTGKPPTPIRWVLLKDPTGTSRSRALIATDQNMDPLDIINCFIKRWTVEVTFQEVRAHLGVETQRQWSDLAIARTTPVLMGTFSIITLWADSLNSKNELKIKPNAWYKKTRPTFSDAIAAVRQKIWAVDDFPTSDIKPDILLIPKKKFKHILTMLARAA